MFKWPSPVSILNGRRIKGILSIFWQKVIDKSFFCDRLRQTRCRMSTLKKNFYRCWIKKQTGGQIQAEDDSDRLSPEWNLRYLSVLLNVI